METKFELDVAVGESFIASVKASGETEIQFQATTPASQTARPTGRYPTKPREFAAPRAFQKPTAARPFSKPATAPAAKPRFNPLKKKRSKA
jgi:hypothetical protein